MKMRGTFCLAVISLLALSPATFAQPPASYLQLWLQAESLANLNSGDKVASWEDSSGTGNTASNPDEATQPVYIAGALNGMPVVRFADGGNAANAGQYLDSLLTLNANGASFSAIVLLRSAASATARDTILQPLNDGAVNNGRTVLYLENNAGLVCKAKSFASETAFESARGCASGEWAIYSLVQDSGAGTVSLWRNGDPDGTASMGAFTTPNSQWRIGDNKPRNGGLQGDIAEILIYNAAIDPVDRAAAEDYLMAKYNLPHGGSGYDVLLRDNFNVSANSNDINFENTLGRQSTLGGAITYLENGVGDAFTQVNNPDAPGMLRLLATPTTSYAAVTPDRNFTDGGNFKIEFDLDAGINDAGGTSGDWACIVFGSTTRGPSFVNSSDGMGILFRNNGPIQVFNGAADTGGGGTLPLGLLHVRIEVNAADFLGSPATVRMFVNDTQIQLGGGMLDYVKENGFRGNYITLAGAAWGGDWVHGFDNLLVVAQPCITPSVFQVKSYPGQNNQSVAVQIPAFLNLNGAVEVTVTSPNPEIAEPVGATAGSLTLDFPPGVTSRSFNISALAHGSTTFTLTGPEGACIGGGITVGVGASLVANPSFEENYNTAWPHYGPISQWNQIPGGNIGINEADGPFHDNGTIPDGKRVALYQGNGGISQMITGLAPGQQYWLQFRYNKRTGGSMALSTYFGGVELDSILSIPLAGPGEYHFRNLPFTPASDSGLLEFRCTATGDATLLLDAVTIIPRGTNQIVVQNPSFEASGEVASPGELAQIAGWKGTGVAGINRIGQDNADIGWNPDQDHVAFIQGVGSLSQVVSNLAIGQLYQIKYSASAKSTDLPTLRVSMGDLVLSEDLVYAGNPGEVYLQYVLEWIATDRAAELKFEQLDDLGGALLLDDIQITGLALPAPETKLSVLGTEFFAGQPLGPTNVTVTLPLYLTATQSIDVVVISLNTNVAVPVGAIGGSLTLRFTAGGPNSLSFDVAALGSGTATFIITNQVDCPGAVFTVRNRTSLIVNPSFEDNSTAAWPGYTEIVNWKGGSGINPITEDHPNGRSPFADNGAIPDRGQVAIIQGGPNALTQELYGLNPSQQYWLQVYVNARNCCGADLPLGSVRFNGLELLPPTLVPVAGGDNPYNFVNVPFTPNSPTGMLELISAATTANGDRTLLLDAVSLVARQSGQIVLQNPSFEASGAPPSPGYVSPLAIAGWSGSGTYGVNISGNGPFADNGAAPEQDNVAFLQTEGSSLSQTINGLIPGASYKLSYAYNARGGNTPQLTVTVNDLVVHDEVVSPVGGSQPYYTTNVTFEADTESVVLRFTQSAADDQTILLDDVKVTGLSGQEMQLTVQLLPAGTVRLSWPVSAGSGWILLSAETLTDTWFESGLLVGEEGEEYVAYDSIALPFKFYRLSRP